VQRDITRGIGVGGLRKPCAEALVQIAHRLLPKCPTLSATAAMRCETGPALDGAPVNAAR
jgi:hypothetical protein